MKLLLFLLCVSLSAETLVIDSGSPTDQYATGGAADFTISYPGATGDLSVRYGAFSYHIPRPQGVYLVTLNFRETGTVSARNQRLFSVKLGGQLVIDRLDLFSVAGLNKIERNYVTASNDGFIDIYFSYVVKSAIVSSIVIQPLLSATFVTTGAVPGWTGEGMQNYVFTLPDGTPDGPYVAVQMASGYAWVKQ